MKTKPATRWTESDGYIAIDRSRLVFEHVSGKRYTIRLPKSAQAIGADALIHGLAARHQTLMLEGEMWVVPNPNSNTGVARSLSGTETRPVTF